MHFAGLAGACDSVLAEAKVSQEKGSRALFARLFLFHSCACHFPWLFTAIGFSKAQREKSDSGRLHLQSLRLVRSCLERDSLLQCRKAEQHAEISSVMPIYGTAIVMPYLTGLMFSTSSCAIADLYNSSLLSSSCTEKTRMGMTALCYRGVCSTH